MAKPEAVTQTAVPWNTSTTPKETEELTVQAGDRLVAFGISEANSVAVAISGGLTWTQQKKFNTANNVFLSLWTATAGEAKSFKVKFTREGGTTQHYGGAVQVWRKASGFGVIAGSTNTEGAPSLAMTTERSGSAIAMCVGDWNAKTGAATYRAGAGAFTEKNHIEDSGFYTIYGGFYAEAGAKGEYTVGMTAPSGQKYTIAAIEVMGEDAAAGAELALGASSGSAAPSLALTAATTVTLAAGSGVAAPTARLTAATSLTLGATSGAAAPTAALTAPALLALTTAGAASTSLSISAPTQLLLGASSGSGSTSLQMAGPVQLQLGASTGAAAPSLQLRAPVQLVLGPAAGATAPSMRLTAPAQVPLGPSTGSATAGLVLELPAVAAPPIKLPTSVTVAAVTGRVKVVERSAAVAIATVTAAVDVDEASAAVTVAPHSAGAQVAGTAAKVKVAPRSAGVEVG